MYEKILVPLDGSALAEVALPYTEDLAGRLGSDVTLLYVSELTEESSQHKYQLYLEKMVEATKQGAERHINKSGRRTVQVKSAILGGSPVEKIAEYADREDIGLIVMAAHGKSGISQRALGSVADKVVRKTNCTVVLIKANDARPEVAGKSLLNKVLVHLDGSKRSETAIPHIGEFASKLEAEVVLFQVLAPECLIPGT